MSKKGYGKRVVSGILCFSLMTGLMPGGLRSKVYAETEMPGQGQVQEIEVTGQASALTVFDGTDTNDCVPMDGYNANIYEKSQYVIPADKLVAMDGKYIESITYYLSQVAETQWNAEFKVYLKEVDYTTMSSCDDLEGATLVYSGGLDGTQSELSIELQDNFEYHGGNLLVAIYTTTPGDFYTACFYGTNTEEVTAISGINDESMDYITDFAEFRFIPKATFAYSDEPSIIHEFTYTAEGDTVTAVCSGDDCVFKDGTTLQILAPEQAYYNGKPWAVTFSDYNRIAFTVVGDVEYYQGETKLESAPVEIGSYTAKVTVGEGEKAATAAVDFEIVGGHNFSYEADGNVITATCDEEECDITEGLTLTVNAPEDLGYDGEAKEATLSDYSEIAFPVVGEIEYYQDDIKLESAPKNIGAYTAMVTVGEGEKAVTAAIDFEIAHEHDFSYEVDGNVITATCDKEECDITEELTLTLNAPEGVFFDGDAWEATLSDYNEEAFPTVGVIEYYQGETKLESAPVNEGSYTAKVTVGEGEKAVTASVSFEIIKNKKITVYDGINGDDYVPVYGFYADAYCKVQYIIPADKLAAISGSDIEAIRYYLRSPASAQWGGEFKVYLKEVDYTAFESGYDDLSGATLVYTGELDGTQSQMNIKLQEAYEYNGGNLLVAIYRTVKESYKSATFLGSSTNYNSAVQGYSYDDVESVSKEYRQFIPKTTFGYSSHNFTYTVNGNTITAACDETRCDIKDGLTVTVGAPENPYYNGEPWEVSLGEYNARAFRGISVEYYQGETKLESAPVDEGTYTVKVSVGKGENAVSVETSFEIVHQHAFTYTLNGATITASCPGQCDITEGLTLTISKPEDLVYDGEVKEATLSDYNETAFSSVGEIEYYQGETKLESAPVNIGAYTAKVTVGEGEDALTAAVDFEIVHEHDLSYQVDKNVITATCEGLGCDITEGLTLTISEPEDLAYDGEAKEATLSDYSEEAFPVVSDIEYYQGETKLESAPVNEGTYTAKITVGEGEMAVTASVDFVIVHEHNFSYTVDGDTITASCPGQCDITEGLTLTIFAPEGVFYDESAWEATLSDYNEEAFPTVGVIEYYQGETKLESAPVNEGSYTAKVTVGEGEKAVTASVSFEITENKEITVYDGINGDDYVPVYGYYADAFGKVQYIIPADKLAAISGSDIEAIRYYLYEPASDQWGGEFKVYLKEVDYTAFESGYDDLSGATLVYTGELDGTQSEMNIELQEKYKYNGRNLLVAIYRTVKGGFKNATFLGSSTNYNSAVQGYSYDDVESVSKEYRKFIPKTTLSYSNHNFTYTVNGNTITAACDETRCDIKDGLTLTVSAPENPYYNGEPWEVSLGEYNARAFRGISVEYYQGETKLEGAPVNEGTYTAKVSVGKGEKAVSVETSFEIVHQHAFTYTVDGDTITASCPGQCDITDGLTMTIIAPEDPKYNGEAWEATLSEYNTTAFPGEYVIEYYIDGEKLDSAPVEEGTYIAQITVGEGDAAVTASVEFTIAHTHFFSYSATGNTITASCIDTCYLDEGLTLTLIVPENAEFTGELWGATLSEYSGEVFPVIGDIEYYQGETKLEGVPVAEGTYTVKITAGDGTSSATAVAEFTIAHKHNFIYAVNGNTVTAQCYSTCDVTDGLTLTLNVPKNAKYDRYEWEATVSDYNEAVFPVISDIEYYKGETKLEGVPVDAGDYTAKVTVGEGDKAVVVSADYTIAPTEFDDDFVFKKGSSKLKYTGSQVKTSVKVLYDAGGDSFTLEKGKDYTVTYSNNVNIGTAKITVKGIGNFTGEKILYFKIVTNLTAQPKNQTVNCGETAVFSAAQDIQGDITYEWQISQDNGNTWKKSGVSGQGTDTINVTAKANYDGYMFRCKISNGTWTEYTKPATLKVKAVISEEPVDKKAYYGNVARFTVKAAGPDMNYQWQVMNASGKWVKSSASGAATATLSVTATSSLNGKKFRCVITSKNNTLTTAEVTLTTVNNIKTQPVDRKVKVGAKTVFTVKAAGNDLSYQWQVYVNGKWVKSGSEGSDTDKLTVTGNMKYNGYKFRCLVTNGTVQTYSDAATLVVVEK